MALHAFWARFYVLIYPKHSPGVTARSNTPFIHNYLWKYIKVT